MKKLLCWIKNNWNLWFLYFLVFSVIGWIYETCLVVFEYKEEFYNRGFLWGPYLPIYGFGGLIIILSMSKIKNKKMMLWKIPVTPVVCFFLITLVATSVELLGSYIMEWTMGEWLWDYTNFGPNFQGRISLESSIRFGIMGMVGLYIIYPLLTLIYKKTGKSIGYKVVMGILTCGFFIDLIARIFLGSNY